MRVLVVEDEPLLAQTVAAGLREEAMAVDIAGDGEQAPKRLAVHDYDVVVLDRDLPGVHGDEVCRRLTGDQATCRILMLTAARSLDDRVAGFGLGADDYLAKPFGFAELVARVARPPPHRSPHRRTPRTPRARAHRENRECAP
jgi:two-component system response regulator VanR